MNKMSFVKGIGVGMAMGAAVGMIASPKKKSSIGKTLKSMSSVVDGVVTTLGL